MFSMHSFITLNPGPPPLEEPGDALHTDGVQGHMEGKPAPSITEGFHLSYHP